MAGATHRDRIAAAFVLLALSAGALQLFGLLWNRSALEDLAQNPGGWWGGMAIAIGTAIVHEALHAVVLTAFARVPWRVRPTWRVLGFAVQPTMPLAARVARINNVLPAIVLGIVPLAVGLASGNGLFVFWGVFCLIESFSDLIALFAT